MTTTPKTVPASKLLEQLDQRIKRSFDTNRRVLSYQDYLAQLAESPETQLRGASQYVIDMLDHFGSHSVGKRAASTEKDIFRYHVYDEPIDGIAPKLVGQEQIQTHIYKTLKSFVRQKHANRLILLHGPNGSSKSTIAHALMSGLERFSQLPQGASYTFNWAFPIERLTRGSIGLSSIYPSGKEPTDYSALKDDEVAARIPCELKDHPILLLPKSDRKEILIGLLGEKRAEKEWQKMANYLTEGDLCHRCKEIYDVLLIANGGDYKKVLSHIQVERFYFSRRYRKALVTIEPQLHVDANYSPLTMNKSLAHLPPSLQNLNLFSLSGDLVDGNRGIIEFSDLLKRPVDTFKYLLGACETGSVNIGSSIAHLDMVMIGSTNELQLDAFKEMPDFSSFKARIDLGRVPYLLNLNDERQIYSLLLKQLGAEKHISPHVDWTLALWAVLTRLKKPNSINYPPNVSTTISNLSPMDKAKLYDSGEMPESLNAEERKLLRTNLTKLREEYTNIPYYEGRIGASVREIKMILFDAVQNPEFDCLSPLSILKEMDGFVKKVSEYEFLKQDVKDGYHDASEFVSIVRNQYLDILDSEVRESVGLYDHNQWETFIKNYVNQISHLIKKEKVRNPITGKSEDPDIGLIKEFEKITHAPQSDAELNGFRQNIISQVGAWSLDHPNQTVVYSEVFPEYWKKLERHFYDSQKSVLTNMHKAMHDYGTEKDDLKSDSSKLAHRTIENLTGKLGYCDHCAKEIVTFLMQKRY